VARMRKSVGHLSIGYCAHPGLQTAWFIHMCPEESSVKDTLTRPCLFKKNKQKNSCLVAN